MVSSTDTQASKRLSIRKEWRLGRLRAAYQWSSASNLWGRFGGGWNWKLGIQVGATTVIISLLVADLRLDWGKPQ